MFIGQQRGKGQASEQHNLAALSQKKRKKKEGGGGKDKTLGLLNYTKGGRAGIPTYTLLSTDISGGKKREGKGGGGERRKGVFNVANVVAQEDSTIRWLPGTIIVVGLRSRKRGKKKGKEGGWFRKL